MGRWERALRAGVGQTVETAYADRVADLSGDGFADLWGQAVSIPGMLSELNGAVLHGVISRTRPGTVVEVGSYLGRSTVLLASTLKRSGVDGHVWAVDPHTGDLQQLERVGAEQLSTLALFREHLRGAGADDVVSPVVAPSTEAARDWTRPIDLLYVDGWHSREAVVADGEAWLPHLTPRGVVFFDDYSRYPEVRAGVHDLARAGVLHVWGNVFGQAVGGAAARPPDEIRDLLALAREPLPRVLFRPVGLRGE